MGRSLFLWACLCFVVKPAWAQDLVQAEPSHARVELENDLVRVVRVRIGPHEKGAMHEHRLPFVAVFLTDARLRHTSPDGTTDDATRTAGHVLYGLPVKHVHENLSDQVCEVVLVELKGAPAAAQPGSPTERAQADTHHQKAEFENDRVRVLRVRVGPHQQVPMHEAPAAVLVWLTDFHARLTQPDGTSAEARHKAGEVAWVGAEKHAAENLRDQPSEFIVVVPKAAVRDWAVTRLESRSPAIACAPSTVSTDPSRACPVSRPNGYTPLGQRPSPDHYGNGALWTALWPDGTVVFRPGGPGFVLPDGSLSMKFPWWRGVRGKLTIQGRRLDAPAPPLRASIPEGYSDTGFQATALIFPTEGCWEVTGKVGEASLTFVIRVVKVGERK